LIKNKKIRILFTIPNFKTAGSKYVLLAIYNNLDKTVFKPFVLVDNSPEFFPESIIEEDRLFLPKEKKPFIRIKNLFELLKVHQIDIVHSWDYKSESLEALACRWRGVNYLYTKKNNAWSKRWFLKSLLSNHVAYDNPNMKSRFFNSIWLKNKVTFIPHGVDIFTFKPLENKKDNQNFTIGCVGVLCDNKNQLFLLKTLRKLPRNIKIEFYGKPEGGYLEKMIQFINLYKLENQVTINEYINNKEMPNIISRFSILVLASKNEGLPLTLLEAMACGIPVLSSDSGGGAKYILGEDEGGFIYHSELELIDKIKQFQENSVLLQKQSEIGIKRVQEHFGLDKEVRAYENLYLKLINR
tara:strand:+ start:7734 stop:8798 length:1065 start_codon:yes stop_codon:yes gene_type:complete